MFANVRKLAGIKHSLSRVDKLHGKRTEWQSCLCFSVFFRKIKFGNNSSSQYLISITNQYLTVWNLLSCTGKVKIIVL